jgi:hypothetical protein
MNIDSCPICQDELKSTEKIRKLPCQHTFHEECINTWIELRNLCPLCKKVAEKSKPVKELFDQNEDDELTQQFIDNLLHRDRGGRNNIFNSFFDMIDFSRSINYHDDRNLSVLTFSVGDPWDSFYVDIPTAIAQFPLQTFASTIPSRPNPSASSSRPNPSASSSRPNPSASSSRPNPSASSSGTIPSASSSRPIPSASSSRHISSASSSRHISSASSASSLNPIPRNVSQRSSSLIEPEIKEELHSKSPYPYLVREQKEISTEVHDSTNCPEQAQCANCYHISCTHLIKRCSMCKQIRYCSKKCQIEHYDVHKPWCIEHRW